MTLVTMTSTVGELTSGSIFRVRAKTAELLVKNSKATLAPGKKIIGVGLSKEGKKDA